MRLWAVNGMKLAPNSARSRPRMPYFSLARTTMDRPSGVSSASEASCAASASSCSLMPRNGLNSVAWRLPSVMVPVLSSKSVSTSPAAARGTDGRPPQRQQVGKAQTTHAGDTKARQERAGGGRDQSHKQRPQDPDRGGAPGIGRIARDGARRKQEDGGGAEEEIIEG